MGPPTTTPVATPLESASQFPDSPTTLTTVKGRSDYEKGEYYLRSSLATLKELAKLLENETLSADQKSVYVEAYTTSKRLYDETTAVRDKLLKQKKSFRKLLVNFFVRNSDAKRFHKVSYWSYSSIRRTSDGLNRLLLPEIALESLSSAIEESPRDVEEDNLSGRGSVEGLCPNEDIREINLDVNTEQEAQEAVAIIDRLGRALSNEEDELEDDDRTIKPSTSQSRPSSPSPSCCTFNIIYNINQSVVSFDSESTGTTLNVGMDGAQVDTQPAHRDAQEAARHMHPLSGPVTTVASAGQSAQKNLDAADEFKDRYLQSLRIFDPIIEKITDQRWHGFPERHEAPLPTREDQYQVELKTHGVPPQRHHKPRFHNPTPSRILLQFPDEPTIQ
ncbi:hypothetical protein DEU56DRAFT_919528 [Suillus clintonianus]|uniref:uncharacterized protein n=1 Tax=Suillus clintonianus TaxID=1904413 RepID=UPI001B884508|nr:uncharacterized protein DEU56DRAFT_919528 [Suillus clintonianus]KAG2114831.1 hypothetical protein DEU56DRAFT_919528 [Suillus clintonianus]